MSESLGDLLRREEEKRNRHLDLAERSRLIQDAIAWGEVQTQRNTKAACLEKQKRLLAGLAQGPASTEPPPS